MAEVDIEGLIRQFIGEANKLIRENEHRIKQSAAPDISSDTVTWVDFEAVATEKLGFGDMGWKSEFERQVGFTEGVLKVWNQKGMVPLGIYHLCALLKPAKLEKAAKVAWSIDENNALRELHGRGLRGDELRKAMQDRFGDRRNYLRDGPVAGACRRLGLRDDLVVEKPVHPWKLRVVG